MRRDELNFTQEQLKAFSDAREACLKLAKAFRPIMKKMREENLIDENGNPTQKLIAWRKMKDAEKEYREACAMEEFKREVRAKRDIDQVK